MLTSRRIRGSGDANTAGGGRLSVNQKPDASKFPKVQDFLAKRDFVGALTLLEFQRSISSDKHDLQPDTDKLIPYCAFHLGDYQKALDEYKNIINMRHATPDEVSRTWLNIACCYFAMGLYSEAMDATNRGNECDLKLRLILHLSHKNSDDDTLIATHERLENSTANLLSLASVHYLQGNFQSAIEIYKKMLLNNSLIIYASAYDEHFEPFRVKEYLRERIMRRCPQDMEFIESMLRKRNMLALNVYVALCYHRLEYYDVSQEVLNVYAQSHQDSAIALNLKACNTFRLYTGPRAEADLRPFLNIMNHNENTKHSAFSNAYDLIRHNLVVFRNGEGALQILPKLLDVLPEARLNLVIWYLHQDDVASAYNLIKDSKPKTVQEHILHAIVNVNLSQQYNNSTSSVRENLALAHTYYNRVGQSETEHDSVFGRLCMASAHFLSRDYENCGMYLNSVRTHYYNDDTFNYNYGQCLSMTNQFKEGLATLLLVQSEKIRNDPIYIQHLARCYVFDRKPRLAWDLYEKMDTSPESIKLLNMIANECYRMGQFFYAAKAFDILEKFDSSPENWEGKRGSCIGVFQLIIAGQEPKESLRSIVTLLRQSSKTEVEKILSSMKKWARDQQYNL